MRLKYKFDFGTKNYNIYKFAYKLTTDLGNVINIKVFF